MLIEEKKQCSINLYLFTPQYFETLSFIVSKEYSVEEIIREITQVNCKLIKRVDLFDEFKGKQIEQGYRSLSFSILLYSDTKTLTDEITNSLIGSVFEALEKKFEIKMR